MTQLKWPRKDPADVLDYSIDWAARLEADTIASSTWTAPAGFTVGANSKTDTSTTVWLSGGSVGTHSITNRITTVGGRTIELSVQLIVEEQ